MRLPVAAVVFGALSTICAADWLEVWQRCRTKNSDHCEGLGYFHTDTGEYAVNGNDGCHKTKVPNMKEFCIDWKNARAHFRFGGQSDKRCLGWTWTEPWERCAFKSCWRQVFEEITCSWYAAEPVREDDGALPFTFEEAEKE